ncbi:4-hydroxy-3-methylbut-2-enyl diphosphate reductase [bacterium]|nr:4-hydroxy-3-methylbut-2-enyl diphosphate reductase [candidate division CSSED10-310 bacterium]
MKIILAPTIGFCSGVVRAIYKALDCLKQADGPIHALGPLIHNPQAVDMLERRGIRQGRLEDMDEGKVVVRAHGISPRQRMAIRARGLRICDTTCPRVLKLQGLVNKYSRQGYTILLLGDESHPEVQGVMGFAAGPIHVLRDASEVAALPEIERGVVVAQTTFQRDTFLTVAAAVKERVRECFQFDTTCPETERRYVEVRELAQEVDALIVVGGRNSRNTTCLVREGAAQTRTFHIETLEDLDPRELDGFRRIGVASGASTPSWIVRDLVQSLRATSLLGRSRFTKTMTRLVSFLSWSGIVTAFGTAGLTYAAAALLDMGRRLELMLLSFTYVLCAFMFNRFIESRIIHRVVPDSIKPFQEYHGCYLLTSVVSGAIAAWLSTRFHPVATGITFALLIGTILTLLPYLPGALGLGYRKRRLKDIYLVKDMLVAFAAGGIAVFIPLFSNGPVWKHAVVPAFSVIFLLVLIRMLLHDLKDAHQDLIMGKLTIPVVMGAEYSKNLVILLFVTWVAAILVAAPLQLTGPAALALLVCPLLLGVYLAAAQRRIFEQCLVNGVALDGILILMGVSIAMFELLGGRT